MQFRLPRNPRFGVLAALLAAGGMWYYFRYVIVPYERTYAARGGPHGMVSDLYPQWWAAHELLLSGKDPYSAEVTREIQFGYYGRVLDPARGENPRDGGFVYPLYVAFLLAPTVHLTFPEVQFLCSLVLLIITAASVPLWLRALGWRTSKWLKTTLIILVLGSLPVVQGIKLQQLTLLVAGLLAAGVASVVCGYLSAGGVLLALSSIKPQLALLPTLLLLLWVGCNRRARGRLALAYGITMLFLVGGSELVLPGWLWRFRTAVEDYSHYRKTSAIFESMLSPWGAAIAAAGLALWSGWLCWPLLRKDRDLAMALALILALTVVLVPVIVPYNQVLLLAPVLLLCHRGGEWSEWKEKRFLRVLVGITIGMFCWPWIASIFLMLASFVATPARVVGWWKLPFLSSLVLPVLVFALTAIFVAKTRLAPVQQSSTDSSA